MVTDNKTYALIRDVKRQNVSKENYLGIVITLILNKNVFSRNNAIPCFLMKVFNINIPDYMMRSRPLMIPRVSKVIIDMSSVELERSKKILVSEMELILKDGFEKASSTNNKNDKLSAWIDILSGTKM